MRLYTIQMARWRQAAMFGIQVLDTTVKSGDKVFAPSWAMVSDIKTGAITEAEYTERYVQAMRFSYRRNQERWLEVLNMEAVALACYCPAGVFCHRHLLADMLCKCAAKHKIPFELRGELAKRN